MREVLGPSFSPEDALNPNNCFKGLNNCQYYCLRSLVTAMVEQTSELQNVVTEAPTPDGSVCVLGLLWGSIRSRPHGDGSTEAGSKSSKTTPDENPSRDGSPETPNAPHPDSRVDGSCHRGFGVWGSAPLGFGTVALLLGIGFGGLGIRV